MSSVFGNRMLKQFPVVENQDSGTLYNFNHRVLISLC